MKHFLLVALLLSGTLGAAPTTNPADLYRAMFTQLDQKKDAWSDLVDDVDKTPLDANTQAFLQAHEPAMKLLRQAATMPSARWGETGGDIDVVLKPLNKVRYVAEIAELEARFDLKQHQPAQAVDNMLAAIALDRNAGLQNLMISRLVEIGIETQAIDRLAIMLPRLPKEVAASLPARLAALPAPGTGKQMMDAEFIHGTAASARQNVPPAIFAAAKPFYQHVGDAMTQPPAQFEQTVDAEALKLALNPFVQTIAGSLKRVQPMLLEMNAKRTMLSSAIAITISGADVAKDSKDPVDGKPFDYTTTAKGFVLTSRAMQKGQPVRLYVGGK